MQYYIVRRPQMINTSVYLESWGIFWFHKDTDDVYMITYSWERSVDVNWLVNHSLTAVF